VGPKRQTALRLPEKLIITIEDSDEGVSVRVVESCALGGAQDDA
jgi:hypothetical protein